MEETFGKRLRALRKEQNVSQLQLAKELDVAQSVISRWELNKCEPTLYNLVKIALYFGVTIDYVLGLEPE